MKLETIYNELKEVVVDEDCFNLQKYLGLMEKLEDAIRLESAYKTTSKTRVNAIKRVASQNNVRPVLTGYGIYGDYKCVTDSYHLIAIKEENMPLKLVTTDSELANKVGKENCIFGDYPNMEMFLKYDKSNEIPMVDMDDLTAFIKLNKKEKRPLYQIGEYKYNANYVKNVIDVLGKECKVYFQGEYRPLFFENNDGEIGLVLPVRTY